jgi:hypothetical protein
LCDVDLDRVIGPRLVVHRIWACIVNSYTPAQAELEGVRGGGEPIGPALCRVESSVDQPTADTAVASAVANAVARVSFRLACEEQAVALLLRAGHVVVLEPGGLAADRTWLAEFEGVPLCLAAAGPRACRFHAVAEVEVVEHTKRFDRVRDGDLAVLDQDQVVAVPRLAAWREVRRAGEDLRGREAEVGDDELVVDVDPLPPLHSLLNGSGALLAR